jgi:hypothetical protein
MTVGITSCATNNLDERLSRAKKTLLMSIDNTYKRNLWKVESFSEKIDSHNNIDFTSSEIFEDF